MIQKCNWLRHVNDVKISVTFIGQMRNHLLFEIIYREIVLKSFLNSIVDEELFETVAALERLEPVQIQYKSNTPVKIY